MFKVCNDYSLELYLKSNRRQTITNRTTPCRCGCGGTDSQHAKRFHRRVKDVAILKYPILAKDNHSKDQFIIARAIAKINGLIETVGLEVWKSNECGWVVSGWIRLY